LSEDNSALMPTSVSGNTSGPQGSAIGDSIEPGTKAIRICNRPSLSHQNEKGGLKRVFGRVNIFQDAEANAHDHGGVPLYQSGERFFVVTGDISLQKSSIRRLGDVNGRDDSPKMIKNRAPTFEIHELAHPLT
jgi:hypothetical protein